MFFFRKQNKKVFYASFAKQNKRMDLNIMQVHVTAAVIALSSCMFRTLIWVSFLFFLHKIETVLLGFLSSSSSLLLFDELRNFILFLHFSLYTYYCSMLTGDDDEIV